MRQSLWLRFFGALSIWRLNILTPLILTSVHFSVRSHWRQWRPCWRSSFLLVAFLAPLNFGTCLFDPVILTPIFIAAKDTYMPKLADENSVESNRGKCTVKIRSAVILQLNIESQYCKWKLSCTIIVKISWR